MIASSLTDSLFAAQASPSGALSGPSAIQ